VAACQRSVAAEPAHGKTLDFPQIFFQLKSLLALHS